MAKHQRSRSMGRPRRRLGLRGHHRRSPSDTTALTEPSSSDDYDYSSCNNNTSYTSSGSSSSSLLYPYRQDLGELERAMWLADANNTEAQRKLDEVQRAHPQQQQHQSTSSLLDTESVEDLTMLSGTTGHLSAPSKSYSTEPSLRGPGQYDERQRVVSPASAGDVGADLAASFDLCSPRYHEGNNESGEFVPTTTTTTTYHRYRPVGKLVKPDSSSGAAKEKFSIRGLSSLPSKGKQDSSLASPNKITTSSAGPSIEVNEPSTATSPAATPPRPKTLSNYKQHILKKHSSLEQQKESQGDSNDRAKAEKAIQLASPTSKLKRPTLDRAKSTPSSLATVHESTSTNSKTTGTTASNTTPATARAMAKLAAARRARTVGDVATTTTHTTKNPMICPTSITSSSSPISVACHDLINEIVSPSPSPSKSNGLRVSAQYVDSDDLLAVEEAASVVSVGATSSIASNTPTVRAGSIYLPNGMKSAVDGTPRPRVLSPLSIMMDDECDTSMASSMAALSMVSNPVSIDECGPIDVDTGNEVDALIDSIAVVSPLYDEDVHRLTEQELKESICEEERFRGVEFPVCDEVEMTRGLASYMRGFEPKM